MKTVYLVRHAKSSWKFSSLKDKNRPLNKRGNQAVPKVAQYLKENNYIPWDMVISSPANRALATAQLMCTHLGFPLKKIQINPVFYNFTNDGKIITEALKLIDDKINTVAVFGHNETLSNLVYKLSKGKIKHFPTAAVLAVSFKVDKWEDIKIANAKKLSYVFPKGIKK